MLVIFHFPKFHTMRGVPESHSMQRRKAWKRKLEKKGSPRGCWVHLVDVGFVLLVALVCPCACLPLSAQL